MRSEGGGAEPQFDPLVQDVLSVLRDLLGFEVALLARIDDDRYEVLTASDGQAMGFSPGLELPLQDTF